MRLLSLEITSHRFESFQNGTLATFDMLVRIVRFGVWTLILGMWGSKFVVNAFGGTCRMR